MTARLLPTRLLPDAPGVFRSVIWNPGNEDSFQPVGGGGVLLVEAPCSANTPERQTR